jgi:mgtE-like transporter
MRGVIGGLFSGRLSTGLHLGIIKAEIFGENKENKNQLLSLLRLIIVLTFQSSIALGFITIFFGNIFLGITIFDSLSIVGILIATMGLSVFIISPITIIVAFSSVKRGLDPDIIVYPIVSTIADILVTFCYVLVLSMSILMGKTGFFIILFICTIYICVVISIIITNRRDFAFKQNIMEAFFTIIIVALIVNITGFILSQISAIIGSKSEIYIVYPALLNIIGGFGAIVGSTATTKLALGVLDSSFKAIKNHRSQIFGAWFASILIYVIVALVSSFFQFPISFISTLKFIGLLLATNVFAASFMIIVSFSVAILTFQKGLDPDNFVIPIESSLADTLTTISLWLMFSIWSLLGLIA